MVMLIFDRLPLWLWGLCFGVALGWWLFRSQSSIQTTSGREQYEPTGMVSRSGRCCSQTLLTRTYLVARCGSTSRNRRGGFSSVITSVVIAMRVCSGDYSSSQRSTFPTESTVVNSSFSMSSTSCHRSRTCLASRALVDRRGWWGCSSRCPPNRRSIRRDGALAVDELSESMAFQLGGMETVELVAREAHRAAYVFFGGVGPACT